MNFKSVKLYIYLLFSGMIITLFFNNCSDANQFNTNTDGVESGSSQISSAPEVGDNFSGKVLGSIDSVSSSGSVWGYALDPNNRNNTIRVYFYVGGPIGKGTLIGSTLANIQSIGPNAGHYYSFTIPSEYADGNNKVLYAYGHQAISTLSLSSLGYSYRAYTPKAELIYNQGMNNLVTSTCNKCHSWNYRDLFYGPLLTPAPTSGGSATNNTLYKKMMGHGGGTYCSSPTDFPCSDIQTWWNAEFN